MHLQRKYCTSFPEIRDYEAARPGMPVAGKLFGGLIETPSDP